MAAAMVAIVTASCTQPPPTTPPGGWILPVPQQTPPQVAPGDIYTPPSPLPPGKPGDVIWYRKAPAWNGNWVTKILYRSVDALGAPMAVTGTIFTPGTPLPGNPVVGFASETVGMTDDCAPSKNYDKNPPFLESNFVRDLVTDGYAVAMTDYEGLGTTHKLHTYMVGPSQAHAVLDALRAALRTPETNIPANAPMALWGYSQGGGAVGAAAEAAGTYAPELPIKGVAAGGVPADLVAVAGYLNGGLGFGFLAAASVGFDAAYPELDLDSFLNDNGRTQLDNQLSRSTCLWALLTANMFKRIENLTDRNPLEDPRWQARLAESKLGSTRPQFPVYLYHATFDEVIPFPQSQRLREAWCGLGASVQFQQYPIAEHLLGEREAVPIARNWLKARFDGVPPTPNCQ